MRPSIEQHREESAKVGAKGSEHFMGIERCWLPAEKGARLRYPQKGKKK